MRRSEHEYKIYHHMNHESVIELTKFAAVNGSNLHWTNYVSLDEVIEHLPELPEGFTYVDEVFMFKMCGNVQPHVDESVDNGIMFLLLDVLPTMEERPEVHLITNRGNFELDFGDYVLFRDGYEHALMCSSGWMAVAVPYKYRKPK